MADPAATLRGLADAVDECLRLARTHRDGVLPCLIDQRDALAGALPGPDWRDSAPALRTMADTVDRLTRERDEARALLAAPKPKRDPLTDPRPGDVVRFREHAHPGHGFNVAEVSQRILDVVTIAYTGDDERERMRVDEWSDWSGFDVQVLHTADEVTP